MAGSLESALPRHGETGWTQHPKSYAYRCLPLKIANEHGWEILSPCGFSVSWNGGPLPHDVVVKADHGANPSDVPEALFGSGIVTFHVAGILRTSPGWDLWVGGPPNRFKDGISPLSGIIETDWSPFTFTMNWRLTRPGHEIRFEENEPFAFFFPIERGSIECFKPKVVPIEEAPKLKSQFEDWSRSRNEFQERMRTNPPSIASDKWQKFYYRGRDASGCPHINDHRSKVRATPFADAPKFEEGRHPVSTDTGVQSKTVPATDIGGKLAKRDWLLQSLSGLRQLSPRASTIARHKNLSEQRFRDRHYALNTPVVLTQAIDDWPAVRLWTPEYLKQRIGSVPIEFQGKRANSSAYERNKDSHRAMMPFDEFIDMIVGSLDGNDAYITAYNSGRNTEALLALSHDVGRLDHILTHEARMQGMIWIGAGGTFTPLHHDLTNNLLVQLTGTKQVLLVPPHETPKLRNDKHVFSQIQDLENAQRDEFPEIDKLDIFRVRLEPGHALFLPLGWWHQVVAEDFSVSMTFTNFRWRNDFFEDYPSD